jgi:hypothetical protein
MKKGEMGEDYNTCCEYGNEGSRRVWLSLTGIVVLLRSNMGGSVGGAVVTPQG